MNASSKAHRQTFLPAVQDPNRGLLRMRLLVINRTVSKTSSTEQRQAGFLAWEALVADAEVQLGADHDLTLEIRLSQELAISNFGGRSARDSATALAALQKDIEGGPSPSPVQLADVRRYRAQFVRKAGALEEGIDLYEEELKLSELAFGEDGYRTGLARNNLVVALTEDGTPERLARARQLALEEIRRRTDRLGEEGGDSSDNASTWVAQMTYAEVLLRIARTQSIPPAAEEALGLAREISERRRVRLGRSAPSTLAARRRIGEALIVLGRFEEAFWALVPILEWEKLVEPKAPGETDALLAEALAGTGHPEDRRQAYEYAQASERKRLPQGNQREIEASRSLKAGLCPT